MLFAITVRLATTSSTQTLVDASAFSAVALVFVCAGLIVGILGVLWPESPQP